MDMKETVIQGIKAALAAAVSAGDLPDGEYPDVLLEVPPQKSSAILRPILPCNRLELLISHRV